MLRSSLTINGFKADVIQDCSEKVLAKLNVIIDEDDVTEAPTDNDESSSVYPDTEQSEDAVTKESSSQALDGLQQQLDVARLDTENKAAELVAANVKISALEQQLQVQKPLFDVGVKVRRAFRKLLFYHTISEMRLFIARKAGIRLQSCPDHVHSRNLYANSLQSSQLRAFGTLASTTIHIHPSMLNSSGRRMKRFTKEIMKRIRLC